MTGLLWTTVITFLACSSPENSSGEQWVEGDVPEREEGATIDVPTHVPFWAGEAEIDPGLSYFGVGWFVVFDGTEAEAALWREADAEKLLCTLVYDAESDQVAQGCSDCEFAFAVPTSGATLETGDASICSEYGMDVEHLATKIDKLGYKDGQLMVGSDGGWDLTQGGAEYIDNNLAFWYLY